MNVINIFFIDSDPDVAARELCDKHVVKMIVESAQLLSTAHRVTDGIQGTVIRNGRKIKVWTLSDERENILYAASHMNHPSGAWVRQSIDNYYWLHDHMETMMDEYKYRYGKIHSTCKLLPFLQHPPHNLTAIGMTPAPSCVPDDCKVGGLVENYRTYYNKHKRHIHKWKNRQVPDWIV